MLNSFKIAVSFLTVIPLKNYPDWNNNNLKYFCAVIPFIGLIIGGCWLIILFALKFIDVSEILKGCLMTLFSLILTGGLHMDGLIDSCDAVFSHKNINEKLKILSDVHAGSFGVCGCAMILILKSALFSEIKFNLEIFLIPFNSRLGMAVLLNYLPFAKSNGLAKILGSARDKSHLKYFVAYIILAGVLNIKLLILNLIVYMIWRRCCMKNFNGITGDLLGAYVEFSEIIFLFGLCV